jgi:hypothetical protein
MDRFFKISYYTAFTVFVISTIMVIFSFIVVFLAFIYWSGVEIIRYLLSSVQ